MDGPRSDADVRQFFSSWTQSANDGDWSTFADLLHDDIVLEDPMSPEPAVGKASALERAKAQYLPFPDGRTEVVGDPFMALDEPVLAYRWHFTGTHSRPIEPPGFAPTGERVDLDGASTLRFRDGLVAEVTLFFDTTAVARQVLAAPRAGSPLERALPLVQRSRAWLRRRRR